MTATRFDDPHRVWDVAVVGSGPAGSAAAIAALVARPTATVLLIDRSDFPRDKCCGDAVFGAVARELAEFGVDTASLFAGYSPVRGLRLVTAGGVTVRGQLSEGMTVIPRTVLDDRLRSVALNLGAVPVQRTVRLVQARRRWVEIESAVRAKIVIGADGAESAVRRSLGVDRGHDVAIALRGYDENPGEQEPVMVLDHRGGLAYAWRFPSTQGGANVGYGHLLRRGERAARSELLATMHRLLPEARPDARTLRAHRLPLATTNQLFGHGRIMLAGDAAALVNPLSGEGIFYAIVSGLAAGCAAVTGEADALHRYAAALGRRFGRHHRDAGVLAWLTRSRPVVEAGVRAAGRKQYVFDDLVGLGLGDGTITARFVRELSRDLLQTFASCRPFGGR